MSHHQELSVYLDVLPDLEEDCYALVSEHVLRRDGNRVAFFHEKFFDYAYARLFVGRNGRLRDLVLDGKQLLFRRTQVRQVLEYKRASRARAEFLACISHHRLSGGRLGG